MLGDGNWNGTAASTTKLPLMRASSGSAAFAESSGGSIGIRLLDRWLPMEYIYPPPTHLRSFLSFITAIFNSFFSLISSERASGFSSANFSFYFP